MIFTFLATRKCLQHKRCTKWKFKNGGPRINFRNEVQKLAFHIMGQVGLYVSYCTINLIFWKVFINKNQMILFKVITVALAHYFLKSHVELNRTTFLSSSKCSVFVTALTLLKLSHKFTSNLVAAY